MMRFLFVFALMFLGLACETLGIAAERPNALFIYTDDQTFQTLSCYRDQGAWPWVRTPNIDRLATEGTRFTSAYGAAWCTPSRMCVLTGKLPHSVQGANITAVLDGTYDPTVCRFWPAELRKSGYETAMIGKWHIGHDSGHGRDWDHSIVWDQADIKGDWYNNQTLSIDGGEKQIVPGYSTDVYTQFAADYIQRSHDKPWLLWLCYNAPHNPQTIAPRHNDRYLDSDVPIPTDVFGPRPGKPEYMQTFTQWKRGADEHPEIPVDSKQKPLPQIVREYNRVVCALDDGIGKLLAALEQSGQLDRTVIIFTSDQGFAWGDHGFAWKVGPYDACLKMPLLVRYPKLVQRGAVCRRPVTVVDLAPTILSLTGASVPWDLHGHDLTPLLKTGDAEPDRSAMMEFFRWEFGSQTDQAVTGEKSMSGIPWWIFLRHGQYKYIRTLVPNEIEEMYDLDHDPHESKNLALEPAHQDLLKDYRARFLAELQRTKAGLVNHLPEPRTLANPVSKSPKAVIEDLRTVSWKPPLYHGWPTLARRKNGELLLAFSGGREAHVCPFGRLELMRSKDNGKTWGWPQVISDCPIDDRDAGVLETPRGSILLTNFTSLAYAKEFEAAEKIPAGQPGAWDAVKMAEWTAAHYRLTSEERQRELGTWMWRSTDGGVTWSARYAVPCNSPHGPFALKDRRLIYLGVSLWTPDRTVGAWQSTDDGQSWKLLSQIPTRPNDDSKEYHELHGVETVSGKLIAHIRNHNRENDRELLQSESTDGGKTWSVPHPIGVWGLPSHLLRLKDGRLLMSYGYRRTPFGNQARVSTDEGKTWSEPMSISSDGIKSDLGYPSTVECDDGMLVTVWYEVIKGSDLAQLRRARWRIE